LTISFGFLLARHPAGRISPIMPEVMRLLRERGARVEAIYPADGALDLSKVQPSHDLYVHKSGEELALSLAGALHAGGAAILHPYPASAACRDKIILSRVLHGAGVPMPATHVATDPAQLEDLLVGGPIVVKPYRGSQGRGVRIVQTPDELDGVQVDGPLIVQGYCEAIGRDRKLYVIGDRVFGVKRTWPARTYRDKLGEPFTVSAELREIAFRCGAALGIDLFGLDVVETRDGPFVVDLSSFPGFKGVPEAARLLAAYIWDAGRRARTGIADLTDARASAAAS
jgi:ribosomal protein S6--L-glutamate ligase